MRLVRDRALLQYDLGVPGYDDCACWLGCSDNEDDRRVHGLDPEVLPFRDRSTLEIPRQVPRSARETGVLGRRERDSDRLL